MGQGQKRNPNGLTDNEENKQYRLERVYKVREIDITLKSCKF